MKLHLWGTDFRRSNAEFRSKLFIPLEQRPTLLKKMLSLGFSDLVYLPTCNRIEFFTTAEDHYQDSRELWVKLLHELQLSEEDFYRGYHLEGKSALRHLIRVASSLESMIIGEPQILGQLKDALRFNQENALPIEPSLLKSFQLAFETAKAVRTETAISKKPISISNLALDYCVQRESDHAFEKVVFIGRSPILLPVYFWLKKNRPGLTFTWVNRNVEKLDAFLGNEPVTKLSLETFLTTPQDFSHLYTAVSSRDPILEDSFFKQDHSKAILFDLGQPHNICETAAAKITRIEDLDLLAQKNKQDRFSEVKKCEKIIAEALQVFFQTQKEAPVMKEIGLIEQKLVQDWLEHEMISGLPDSDRDLFRKIGRDLIKKNLHQSREDVRKALREAAAQARILI